MNNEVITGTQIIIGGGIIVLVALIAYTIIYLKRRQQKRLERLTEYYEDKIRQFPDKAPEEDLKSFVMTRPEAAPALYLREIEIRNIRCFTQLHIKFISDRKPVMRISILGDNALGKSTLLRAITLALCNESDAVALMKSIPGELITKGEKEGRIRVVLSNDRKDRTYEIEKVISHSSDGSEALRQKVPRDFPWTSVFICGYGTRRTETAHASFDKYSPRHAVSTLFDVQSSLQNPELVLLRQGSELRQILQKKLMNIVLLDDDAGRIEDTTAGLNFHGPWGSIPLDALSDGYRSTTQWLLDLFAWMIYTKRLPGSEEPAGILLIDEIEQHLHPRWQRHILQRLSRQLPRMQIITTTHTPLVASGTTDIESSIILRLKKVDDKIEPETIDPALLKGKRADQVLILLFDLITSRSPGSSQNIPRYAELSSKTDRTEEEEKEFSELSTQLEPILSFGENEFERNVERAVSNTLDQMLKSPPKELDLEVKRQLRELFHSKD